MLNGVLGNMRRQQTLSDANPGAIGLYRAFGDPGFEPGFNYTSYDLGLPGMSPFGNGNSAYSDEQTVLL